MASLHVWSLREEFTWNSWAWCITFSSMMYWFGQDILFSPSVTIPDPNLSHIYLYSLLKLTLVRGISLALRQNEHKDLSSCCIPSHCTWWTGDNVMCCTCQAQGVVKVCACGFSAAYRFPCREGDLIFHTASKRQNGTA